MKEFKCKRCDREFDSYESLKRHTSRLHKIKSSDFYVEFNLNGVYPVCKCGCGKKVSWNWNKFREYAGSGHSNKIHNNWGHNPKAILNSAETRRKQYANGEREPWCKGLSTKTDERLKRYGEKISNSFTEKRKREYSERMKNQRKNGTIKGLTGQDHSQWKGGVSSIQQIARSDRRLYEEWKYPILKESEFKCSECQNIKDLQVHHDKETFSEIIKKVMTIDDYEHIEDFERKKQIVDKIVDYHVENTVSGKVLCRDCHGKLHPSLNFK